jgi:hypothetical protein
MLRCYLEKCPGQSPIPQRSPTVMTCLKPQVSASTNSISISSASRGSSVYYVLPTLVLWDIRELAFMQPSFPVEGIPSIGLKTVDGFIVTKLL